MGFPLESWPAVFLPWLFVEGLVDFFTVLAGDFSGIPPVGLADFLFREDLLFGWNEFGVVLF